MRSEARKRDEAGICLCLIPPYELIWWKCPCGKCAIQRKVTKDQADKNHAMFLYMQQLHSVLDLVCQPHFGFEPYEFYYPNCIEFGIGRAVKNSELGTQTWLQWWWARGQLFFKSAWANVVMQNVYAHFAPRGSKRPRHDLLLEYNSVCMAPQFACPNVMGMMPTRQFQHMILQMPPSATGASYDYADATLWGHHPQLPRPLTLCRPNSQVVVVFMMDRWRRSRPLAVGVKNTRDRDVSDRADPDAKRRRWCAEADSRWRKQSRRNLPDPNLAVARPTVERILAGNVQLAILAHQPVARAAQCAHTFSSWWDAAPPPAPLRLRPRAPSPPRQ